MSRSRDLFVDTFVIEGEPTLLYILLKKGADLVDSSQKVQDIIDSFLKEDELDEYDIITTFNNSEVIENRIKIVYNNMWIGFVVVFLVLLVFFPFRTAAISSPSIPITLLGTLGVLSYLDITLNVVSLLGLIVVIGLIVDNSIVISENFMISTRR